MVLFSFGLLSMILPNVGAAILHDGRPISGKDIMTLEEKLRELGRKQPVKLLATP